MNKSKAAIAVSRTIEMLEFIGGGFIIASIALSLPFAFSSAQDDVAVLVITLLIMLAFGVWVFLCGIKRKKMRQEFKKYVSCLSKDPTGLIANIAAATGTSTDVVKKNLKFMIKKQFFVNAYIDEQNNQLVLASLSNNTSNNMIDNAVSGISKTDDNAIYKPCTCPNCGGLNKVIQGKVAECDFCGSPIQG